VVLAPLTVGGDFTEQQLSSLWKKISTVGKSQSARPAATSRTHRVVRQRGLRSHRDREGSFEHAIRDVAGAQYYRKQNEAILAHGETFPVNDLETISSGALKTAQETFVENKTVGLYIQEQFAGGTAST
jgi:hypothetical protein